MIKFILLFCLGGLLASCRQQEATLFTRLPASATGITFRNDVAENEAFNLVDYYYVYNGGGVAVGDINNDGLPDLYFTGNQVSDRLYLNKGNFQFEDITARAGIKKQGWSTGVTMADVNADGLLDIYVSKSGNYKGPQRANQLYLNSGKLTFTEEAARYGLADTTFTNQAAFFDYDKDGDLDLYLLTSTNRVRNPNQLSPLVRDGSGLAQDKLYRNDTGPAGPRYTELSRQAGILHDGFGLGLAIADINKDGWEDVYVANDFLSNDFLYINNQDGTFREEGKSYFKHHSQFSMGTDIGDINNDGLMDVVVADMLPADNEQRKKMAGPATHQQFEAARELGYHPQFMRNMLQVNLGQAPDGRMVFAELGQQAGIHSTDWSWSPLLADFDNDGWRDLYFTNGYLRDITDLDFVSYNNQVAGTGGKTAAEINQYLREGARKMPSLKKTNYLFRNQHNLQFADVTQQWSDGKASLSQGAAYADLDGDGDLDLVVNNMNEEAAILQNNTRGTHYLQLRLQGPAQNRFGLGADLVVYAGGQQQHYHQAVTRGYQSSVDYTIHFGLGASSAVDSLVLVWPDGKAQVWPHPPIDTVLQLSYRQAVPVPAKKPVRAATWLEDISATAGITYTHQEVPYMDYNQEPLLLQKHSRQGPRLAVGDVNGDGLEDFFAGGSYRHYGQLFLQTAEGKFLQRSYTDESRLKEEEDVGVQLLDVDGDKDLDLYLVSGSNEYFDGSPYYQDRLYRNNGRGVFSRAAGQLPRMGRSGSCLAAADFDRDGDLDIFRGGRLSALHYGRPGESLLLQNHQGTFRDMTDQVAPGLKTIGMVTDAVWVDVNRDGWPDLMVVGEFMPITLLQNNKGKLVRMDPEALKQSEGLWNCIRAGDFDQDGDQDLVAGNLGRNSRYQLSATEPLSVHGSDYDGNGRYDAIASYFLQGRQYPIASRDELGRQLPGIKRTYTTYGAYARASMRDLLRPDQVRKADILRAYRQESAVLENTGQDFVFKALPPEAQWAPIQSFWVDDLDEDGKPDLLAVGNDYGIEPVAGQYDAFTGLVLQGTGKGRFRPLLFPQSGFLAEGDARSVVAVHTAAYGKVYVVASNQGPLKVFRKNR